MKKDEVVQKLSQNPENNEIKEVVMTLAEQWKQEGIEKGKIGVVTRLLNIRFRNEADPWIKKLNRLSSKDLDTVSERILTANSLSEVFYGIL